MKRFVLIMLSIFTCAIATAATETINWYIGDTTYATTTCQTGGDITLPQTPTKYGYTFNGWKGYIPIEYLENNAYNWINANYFPSTNSTMEIKFICGRGGVAAARDYDDTTFGIWNTDSSATHIYHPAYVHIDGGISNYTPNIIKISPVSTVLNGSIIRQYDPVNFKMHTSIGIFTFRKQDASNLDYCNGRIYYLKIYDNDVLVRDFIPVIDDNGVACMFDKVEGKFYYNAGTGQFIAGPVLTE